MIDKRFDRKFCRQISQTANMVAVIMRSHEIIDLRKPRLFCDADDAVSIAATGPTGIDQKRLPGRRHE